jgi:kynurenine formamidase
MIKNSEAISDIYNVVSDNIQEIASLTQRNLFSNKLRLILRVCAINTLIWIILFPLSSIAQNISTHAPITRVQFDALFEQVDNAQRWGETDQKGTLNHITPESRRMAAAEVRDGVTVSMAREMIGGTGQDLSEPLQLRFMALSDTLLGPADGSVMWAMEQMEFTYHGFIFTHVDALSHMSYNDRIYNAPAAAGPDGAPIRGTVGEMRDGIVTRGVLVDVPRLRNIPYLEGDVTVTVADLESWEQQTGVSVRSGDVLLIRSGLWARVAELGPDGPGEPGPRIHPTVALWLHERGVAALGADFNDGAPLLVPGINAPLHVLTLVAMGMPLFDNMDLEEISREAATRSRHTFLFMAAPLNIRGGTGSPLNPLAVF